MKYSEQVKKQVSGYADSALNYNNTAKDGPVKVR